MNILRDLTRAKITFQARTLRTVLTEGMDMTDQSNSSDFSVNAKSLIDAEAKPTLPIQY